MKMEKSLTALHLKEGVVDGFCSHENNTCLSGTLNDTPDINTTFRWQCVGQNGGITDECDSPNTINRACSQEGLLYGWRVLRLTRHSYT